MCGMKYIRLSSKFYLITGVFYLNDKKEIIKSYFFIMIGTTLIAAAINMFYDPNQIVTGGVTGLAIIIGHIAKERLGFDIPLWLTNLVLNIPLFLAGMKTLGRKFLLRTLFATFYLSFALYYTKILPVFANDMVLIAVFGGVTTGVGLGLVFRSMATTGGTDLAASILHRIMKGVAVSRILFLIDSSIIVLGLFIFGVTKGMYAVIAVYITSYMIDVILEGLDFAKAAFIISDLSTEISNELMSKVERGVTSLSGRGMYTNLEKNVLLCVVSKKQVFTVKEIVKRVDKKAFVIVADVREVMGEGFGD